MWNVLNDSEVDFSLLYIYIKKKELIFCQQFQFVAKKLDKRLLDLGAVPIVERGLGDDQHPSGYGYNHVLMSTLCILNLCLSDCRVPLSC